jgi:hypothetical protein
MSPDSDWQATSNDKMKWAEAARDYMMRLGHADPGKRGAVLEEGRRLALAMKSAGAMEDLAWLTDRLRSYLEHDAEIRCLQAQALVDLGMPLAAKDVLTAILRVTSPGSDCWLEAQGLKGRIYKQIFLNARNRADQHAVAALKAAITAYRTAFESAPERSPWQGVNLAALVLKSRLMGRRIRTGVDPADVAQQVCTVLDQKADSERDQWWHATYAEAELARGRVDAFATHLKLFLSNPQTDAFALGSFL